MPEQIHSFQEVSALRPFLVLLFMFCLLPLTSADPKNTLNGKHFRVGVLEDPPWTIIKSHNRIRGLASETFEILARFLNFTFSFKPYNGTFDGFIDELSACADKNGLTDSCQYDIGGSAWAVSTMRSEKAHFSSPISKSTSFRVITRADKTHTKADLLLLVKPFSHELWLVLLFLGLLTILVILLDSQCAQNTHTGHQNLTAPRKFWSSLLQMIGQALNDENGRRSSKIYIATSLLFKFVILMVLLTYEATLASMRSNILQPEGKFRSAEDLRECRLDISNFIVVEDTAAHGYVKRQVLSSQCNLESKRKPQLCSTSHSCFKKVADGEVEFVLEGSGIGEYFVSGPYCGKLVTVGNPLYISHLGFVLPLKSPHIPIIDWSILKLQEDDEFPALDDELGKCDALTPGPTTAARELVYTLFLPAIVILVCFLLHLIYRVFIRRFWGSREQEEHAGHKSDQGSVQESDKESDQKSDQDHDFVYNVDLGEQKDC